LYLNLDPSRFATPEARASQLNSLLRDLTKRAESLDLPHDQAELFHETIDRIRARFAEWKVDGAAALGVFASGEWIDVVPLPRPVEPDAHLNDTLWVEPLIEQLEQETWAVLMVNRRFARI